MRQIVDNGLRAIRQKDHDMYSIALGKTRNASKWKCEEGETQQRIGAQQWEWGTP